jgi:hypothetical protein
MGGSAGPSCPALVGVRKKDTCNCLHQARRHKYRRDTQRSTFSTSGLPGHRACAGGRRELGRPHPDLCRRRSAGPSAPSQDLWRRQRARPPAGAGGQGCRSHTSTQPRRCADQEHAAASTAAKPTSPANACAAGSTASTTEDSERGGRLKVSQHRLRRTGAQPCFRLRTHTCKPRMRLSRCSKCSKPDCPAKARPSNLLSGLRRRPEPRTTWGFSLWAPDCGLGLGRRKGVSGARFLWTS